MDAPGILHHVRVRGIERSRIFVDDFDRLDFLRRLEEVCADGAATIYAWCLMDNHVHLSIRTGTKPLSKTMSGVLAGYATSFNLRHKRSGHLFQNRFDSSIVEEERYFLSLVRYIHLNPLRANMVPGLAALARYPWTGHGALLGEIAAPFQQKDEVLARFGETVGKARRELVLFMNHPDAEKEKRVFKGARGGLIRSMGEDMEAREGKPVERRAYDERILGSGEFVEEVWQRTGAGESSSRLTPEERWQNYEKLLADVCAKTSLERDELNSGSRRKAVVEARQAVAYIATRKLGLSCAAIARTMGVSGPAIIKAARKGSRIAEEMGLDESW